MHVYQQTGWMSNRGRQNVASFLVKDLGLDWRLGAEWFESLLLDHDVCSNYGNWNYAAGKDFSIYLCLSEGLIDISLRLRVCA